MNKLSIKRIAKSLSEASSEKSPIPNGKGHKDPMKVPTNKSKDGSTAENKPSYSKEKARPEYKSKKEGPKFGGSKIASSKDSVNNQARKVDVKTGEHGKDMKPGLKPAKSPEAPKSPKAKEAKSPIPSTYKPMEGEPGFKKKSDPKPPSVGTMDKIKGSFLPGMNPNSYKRVDIKVKTTEVGGINEPVLKPVKAPKNVSEAADGSLSVLVNGKEKVNFQAPCPRVVRRVVESYLEMGRGVTLQFSPSRSLYGNREFHRVMMEAAHLRHHGVSRKDQMTRALRIMSESLSSEFNELYRNKRAWVSEALKPALKAISKNYDAAYRDLLEDFDVQVRTSNRKGVQDLLVSVLALNEGSACKLAVDKVLSEDGLSSKISSVFVGGKKVVRESAEKSVFSVSPKFLDDMPGPMGKLGVKSSKGDSAENKPKKPDTLKPGTGGSASADVGGKKVAVAKLKDPKNKGGDFSKKVDKDPKPHTGGEKSKQVGKSSDGGPIYEEFDAVKFMQKLAKKMGGAGGKTLRKIAEKVMGDEELNEKESEVLDLVITQSLTEAKNYRQMIFTRPGDLD